MTPQQSFPHYPTWYKPKLVENMFWSLVKSVDYNEQTLLQKLSPLIISHSSEPFPKALITTPSS